MTEQEQIYEHYKSINIPSDNLKKLAEIFVNYKIPYTEMHEILRILHRYGANTMYLDEMTKEGISSEMLEKLLPGMVQPSRIKITMQKVCLSPRETN